VQPLPFIQLFQIFNKDIEVGTEVFSFVRTPSDLRLHDRVQRPQPTRSLYCGVVEPLPAAWCNSDPHSRPFIYLFIFNAYS
jgi:hypothetical protein